MFDAIWTAALALNRTENRLREKNLALTDFDYDDEHNISGMIYEEAINVNFFGLTVSHSHNCINNTKFSSLYNINSYVCSYKTTNNRI